MTKKLTLLLAFIIGWFSMTLAQTVIDENFDNGIPSTWTVIGTSTGSWHKADFSEQGTIGTYTNFAFHSDDANCNDFLITPAITVTSDSFQLSFGQVIKYPAYGGINMVVVMSSTDTTSVFDTIYNKNSDTYPEATWFNRTIDLGKYNGSTIYLGFKYYGSDADMWAIDSVWVGKKLNYDMKVEDFLPHFVNLNNPPSNLKVVVRNFGLQPASDFIVSYTVYDEAGNELGGDSTEITSTLNPGQFDTIPFTLGPAPSGKYTVKIHVSYASDLDLSNNTKYIQAYVGYGAANVTDTVNNDYIFDDKGPFLPYTAAVDTLVTVLVPDTLVGNTVNILFDTIDIGPSGALIIHDGKSISDPVLYQCTSQASNVQVTPSSHNISGALTLEFIRAGDYHLGWIGRTYLTKRAKVVLNVNMKPAIRGATTVNFNPDADTLYLSGEMYGWPMPGTDTTLILYDPDKDSIYTYTMMLQPGYYEYKYFKNYSWNYGEWDGNPNRAFNADTNHTTIIYDTWATQTSLDTFIVMSNLNHIIPNAKIQINPINNSDLLSASLQTEYNGTISYPLANYNSFQVIVTADNFAPTIDTISTGAATTTFTIYLDTLYTLAFHVQLNDSTPLPNTKILINNTDSIFTDQSGNASIRQTAGNYNISFFRHNYYQKDTSVSLNSDTTITVNLIHLPVNFSLHVIDDTLQPIPNARVIVDTDTLYTDTAGNISLTVNACTSYFGSVYKIGYDTVAGSVDIDTSDVLDTVMLNRLSRKLVFTLIDKVFGNTIDQVNISINNTTLTTDSYGNAAITLKTGYYLTYFYRYGYKSKDTTFNIIGAIPIPTDSIRILLEPATYPVTFNVYDTSGSGLDSVIITCGDSTWVTDTSGQVVTQFYNGTYTVTFSKNGYQSKDTTFDVNYSSHTINITLLPQSVATKLPETNTNIVLYPNPTHGIIKISNAQGWTMDIFNVRGQKILTRHIKSSSTSINLAKYGKGLFIIRLSNKSAILIKKLIVN